MAPDCGHSRRRRLATLGVMKIFKMVVLAIVLVGLGMTCAKTETREYLSGKFTCTRRAGDWGLFKQQPEGLELIACFGGLASSQDDETLCRAALAHEIMGGRFHCAAFQ